MSGFRVEIQGEALSDDEIGLTFKRVIVNRKKRKFPFFAKRLVIPLPSFRYLNAIARLITRGKTEASRRAYFQIQYIDNDFCMHKTGDGNWFIQTRLW